MSKQGGKIWDMLRQAKQERAAVETENEQLRQQLAAEQSKSAELERKYEREQNLRTRLENEIQIANGAMALGCETVDGYKQKNSEQQATIAAMRSALEEIRGEMICENCIAHTVRAGDDYEEPPMFCELNPQNYQYSSGTCEKWHANYDAGILAHKALSNTAGAEYAEWVKRLEEALRLVLQRYHKLDSETVAIIKAVLGGGNSR